MYGIDEVTKMWYYITKDDYLKYMTNEVGDVNRYLLHNGYSVKNIREERGVYIIEVF